ncbi:MAG: mechanosensitive ion channel family protein [Ruminiclostridium sp.]|nr:mechanosensitive ion channel family protein [Ruminiclostridium sp.]MBQ9933791.1 mechanosensitive ion channel family protein [Ruminiclostridium sp.]
MSTNIDTEALGESISESWQALIQSGWEGAMKTIFFSLLLLILCLVVKRIIMGLVDRALARSKIEPSFHKFIHSAAKILLWFIILTVVAESLGINATSLLALVSIAGLAISLSVQDTLANLAGGLSILATHPFKVGDYVVIGSAQGYVREIGMVHTKLTTFDRQVIILPNSVVSDAEVDNHSTESVRRVQRVITASYEDPVDKVKAVLLAEFSAHPAVLADPAPYVRVSDFGDSAIEYTIRLWCKNEDYWTVYDDVLDMVKTAFDREGISIPYPQMEVRIKE